MTAMPCTCAALFEEEEGGAPVPPGGATGQLGDGNGGEALRFGWRDEADAPPPRDEGDAPHLPRLREIGLEGFIDAHSHWFPDNVMDKIWDYFDRHYWPVTYRHTPAERLQWVRHNGVSRFTTLHYAHRPQMAEWLNDWTVAFVEELPDAIACGTFYPEPEVGRYVRRCIEEYGFRGFKLHLRVGHMDPSERRLDPAFEQIAAAGLPVTIHSGSAPDPGPYTAPEYVKRLLMRHPELKVTVAHMGAWEFETYMALAESNPRVYLDTTMVFVGFDACGEYPAGLLQRVEAISEQVLFGSDFPNIPYPLSHAVEGILALPLSPAAKRRILYDNAARLYGVDAA